MKTRTKTKTPEILHRGSLMTNKDDDAERCFGYMFNFPDRGVFDPTFGKLDVSPDEANTHNQSLSQAEIDGLDHNCTVGLGGTFYLRKESGRPIVTTWLGQEVSQEVRVSSRLITFTRKGRTFRGRLRKDEGCFFFKRIE
jgi:hypothetical protein